jgi:hypothetical protein
MFFIPIAAIVIFIWLIIHSVQGGRMAKLNIDVNRSIAKTDKLQAAAVDWDADYNAEMKLRNRKDQIATLSALMGGGPDWDLYASNLETASLRTLSMNALLVRDGHLSSSLASHVGTTFYGRSMSMSREQWCSMTEQVLLKLADEITKKGIPAIVICRRSYPGVETIPDQELRSYIAEHGPGQTQTFSYRMTSP